MANEPLDLDPIKERLREANLEGNMLAADIVALIAEVERLRTWAGILLDAIDRMA